MPAVRLDPWRNITEVSWGGYVPAVIYLYSHYPNGSGIVPQLYARATAPDRNALVSAVPILTPDVDPFPGSSLADPSITTDIDNAVWMESNGSAERLWTKDAFQTAFIEGRINPFLRAHSSPRQVIALNILKLRSAARAEETEPPTEPEVVLDVLAGTNSNYGSAFAEPNTIDVVFRAWSTPQDIIGTREQADVNIFRWVYDGVDSAPAIEASIEFAMPGSPGGSPYPITTRSWELTIGEDSASFQEV